MRKIIEISEEIRRGPIAESHQMPGCGLDGCIEAVKRLNGLDRTLVCVTLTDGAIMIGGGGDGYVVTMDLDDRIINVVDRSADEGELVEIAVGGQSIDYPAMYVVAFDMVASVLVDQLTGEGRGDYEVVMK